jgi:ABC-type multidrug transport system ATPase subunit
MTGDRSHAPAVELRSVSKSFGAKAVVVDVSFSVATGTCFGLMGPNGAGKSTTLKMICGIVRPSSGTVLVEGADVARAPREVRARLGIAPQEDLLDSDLTVSQNLFFHARYHRFPAAEAAARSAATLRETGLEGHAAEPVSHLSTGLRRRLVLARALLNDPAIVILDEPTRGLDRESRARYLGLLQRLKARGATLLLATHDLSEAEALCDRAALVESGRIRAEGSLWEILELYRAAQPEPSPVAEAAS